MKVKIVNINYKGRVIGGVENLKFYKYKPRMAVLKGNPTVIVFENGSCRVMGCKEPIQSLDNLPVKIVLQRMQSATLVIDLGKNINLYKLAESSDTVFEPELFPSCRLGKFNPICVNVFCSGKIVVTGLKTLDYTKLVANILLEINI